RLLYRFKRPWRDGTTHVVFEPLELLENLVAVIPAPKAHVVRYSGIFGPAAKWRAQIVPGRPEYPLRCSIRPALRKKLSAPTRWPLKKSWFQRNPRRPGHPLFHIRGIIRGRN